MNSSRAATHSRTDPGSECVSNAVGDQDRSLWDTELIAEGIDIAHAALRRYRLGEERAHQTLQAARLNEVLRRER